MPFLRLRAAPKATEGTRYAALTALATSTFVFVTAETLPVGLLPQIAHGLSVTDADVGLLLTAYAGLAAITAIPFTALTMRVPRHQLIAVTAAIFTVSQFAAAFAPTFLMLVLTRLVCALAHGVFWSVIGPVAGRLAPPGRAGRATSLVFVGNSLALVFGVPLGTALGQLAGWRFAMGCLGAAGALSTVALVVIVPHISSEAGVATLVRLRAATNMIRSRVLTPVCAVTTVLVIGQFAAYTYIVPLVRRDGGLHGLALSALLFGYGTAGLIGNFLIGRIVDHRPGPALAGSVGAVGGALILLTAAHDPVVTVLAVLVWGAAFTAVPVSLQSAVLRVAPRGQDAASAVYVVAFQIGIGSGAFVGNLFVRSRHLGGLPAFGAVLAVVAGVIVVVARQTFPRRVHRAPDESDACLSPS